MITSLDFVLKLRPVFARAPCRILQMCLAAAGGADLEVDIMAKALTSAKAQGISKNMLTKTLVKNLKRKNKSQGLLFNALS